MATASKKKPQGFASMSRDKQREIAAAGGRAAHEKGTAHKYTSEEGRAAAQLSIAARRAKR